MRCAPSHKCSFSQLTQHKLKFNVPKKSPHITNINEQHSIVKWLSILYNKMSGVHETN